MRYPLLLANLCLLLLLPNCQAPAPPVATSTSPTEFRLDFRRTDQPDTLLSAGHLTAREATAAFREMAGETALEITTVNEFCDVLIDCESLLGRTINLADAGWLRMRLYVPEESWVRAMKLNLGDGGENFGGVSEVANNFRGRYGEWFEVAVDMRELRKTYQNWVGEKNVLSAVSYLSFNPYCANQADSSRIYVSYLEVSDKQPEGAFAPALADWPEVHPNTRCEFTFEDTKLLHDQLAYRTFESSNQALARGVAGNETMAIRIRGREHLNNIAFLPIVEEATGNTVDFTKVNRIYFDYYLTPESATFDGSTLALVTRHWESILADSTFYVDFVPGEWRRATVEMADLQLNRVKGEQDVLRHVAELRLNLNYRPGEKNIEMWLDNFGWE